MCPVQLLCSCRFLGATIRSCTSAFGSGAYSTGHLCRRVSGYLGVRRRLLTKHKKGPDFSGPQEVIYA